MSEDGGADAAGPHPQGGGELAGHLRVAGQVLPQTALVDVELPAHRARVVGTASLSWGISTSVNTELRSPVGSGISTRDA